MENINNIGGYKDDSVKEDTSTQLSLGYFIISIIKRDRKTTVIARNFFSFSQLYLTLVLFRLGERERERRKKFCPNEFLNTNFGGIGIFETLYVKYIYITRKLHYFQRGLTFSTNKQEDICTFMQGRANNNSPKFCSRDETNLCPNLE